jgi:hypothetical protein
MKFNRIIKRGNLDLEQLRYDAVCLSVAKEDGTVNLMLAKAIVDFVGTGNWIRQGQGIERETLERIVGKDFK